MVSLYSLSTLLVTISAFVIKRADKMDCGRAKYCGVLTLERGDGPGNYYHDTPVVHGLWPENGQFGNSACVGGNKNQPMPTVPCYTDKDFQQHEWEKHGYCAASTPTSFFNTVCSLSKQPLELMADWKREGYSLDDMASAFEQLGFGIFDTNPSKDELMISVCAGTNLQWKFSTVRDFSTKCGN
ncbi:hypothetical protein BC833DRAFT_578747 [Globomyces pollinis-pini]|nr:hypothetical protein BC833DRAFT_578747 [Globomyces pollinis-pini]